MATKLFTDITVRNYSYMFYFEKEFVYQEKIDWMQKNWTYAFYFIALYICIIFGIKHYMEDKPRYSLKALLVFWNLGLTAFSIIAFTRTLPEVIHIASNHGFYYSVCVPSFIQLDCVSSYWAWMTVLSKVVELGDTIFIVLRKQPLIFLHWYHHTATLLLLWHGYPDLVASSRWYLVMNLFVHSIMYFYYALKAMGYTLPIQVPIFITALQVTQMVIGIGISLYMYNLLNNNVPCGISYKINNIFFLVYLSYLILFANLFYQSYIVGKKVKKYDIKTTYLLIQKQK